MLGFMTQSIYFKVRNKFTKKQQLSACVCVCVCLCVYFSDEVCFSFPDKNDGFQLHLEEYIYSIANIKMTSSVITNEGKPDEECCGLSREYYSQTPLYEGVLCR
jgi:hypothetical protein